ncbi:hypothetical protein B0T10DRAFT_554861 [Thelonectria olida]|uniref:Zn(2)-C6 fungal-type domain-containing protein n=1 Tax=Thelonectria olida TaxID=1576542 RepID=A0A9P8WIX6_9HYPO|nr:hypothetical protein B0T10DRAFT_554861 [Thelonectria olida]
MAIQNNPGLADHGLYRACRCFPVWPESNGYQLGEILMLVERYVHATWPIHPSLTRSNFRPYIFMAQPVVQQDPSPSLPKSGLQRAGAPRSRAAVRASLACVPCRSKHTKCDGTQPVCVRCELEGKACFYAKSRRGTRLPKKQNESTDESRNDQPSDNSASPDSTGLEPTVNVTKAFPGGWRIGPELQPIQCMKYLVDQYYLYFHDSHPWLPPKTIMSSLIQTRPDEFGFTMAMIAYIGSIYISNMDTNPLREKAFRMASGPLNNSVWDVQALLSISIAACGEGQIGLCGTYFDKALQIALELGLQSKDFSEAEDDRILAESYRRTYWALYLHGSLRTVREHLGHFQLFSTTVTTELPCEEWEYQTGQIPTAVTLQDYERNPCARNYSSWAYLVGLIRISGTSVVPILNVGSEASLEAIDRANHRVETWFQQLPHWKQQLVDPSGAVDMILYHALGIAFGLQIRIQLHLCGIGVGFRVSDLVRDRPVLQFPSPPPSATMRSQPWLHGSTALSASLGLVGLFRFRLPPEKFSPSCTLGIERAVMPMLDAYMDRGQSIRLLREKIVLLASVLRKAGEFWPIAKGVSKEIFGALEKVDQSLGGQPTDEHVEYEHMIDRLALEGTGEGEFLCVSQALLTGQTEEMTGARDHEESRRGGGVKIEEDGSWNVL